MTYEEFIQNILDTRGRFACGDEYHERHHIVPKCMNGTNDKNNLIDLYAKEHFIAHKLLVEENPDNRSLIFALNAMSNFTANSNKRYTPSPEEYEYARKKYSDKLKEVMIGERNPNYGNHWHHTEDSKKILSEKFSGDKNPMYGIILAGANNGMYGKTHTQETKAKMSEKKKGCNNPLYGKKRSEEFKEKMRERFVGNKNPSAVQIECEGCIYETMKAFGEAYNISKSTVQYWIRNNKIPEEWKSKGLKIYKESYTVEKHNNG